MKFPNDETGELIAIMGTLFGFCGLLWLGAIFAPRIPRLAGQVGLLVVFAAILATLVVVRVRAARATKKK
jgi:hypothetical protein